MDTQPFLPALQATIVPIFRVLQGIRGDVAHNLSKSLCFGRESWHCAVAGRPPAKHSPASFPSKSNFPPTVVANVLCRSLRCFIDAQPFLLALQATNVPNACVLQRIRGDVAHNRSTCLCVARESWRCAVPTDLRRNTVPIHFRAKRVSARHARSLLTSLSPFWLPFWLYRLRGSSD